tara:strand:- start:65 stop:445 length:381 start_codon:yes stop_codon:yes gene_type:complete
MGDRIKPIIGAWATGCVISYLAVTQFFNPAMAEAGEELAGGLVPNLYASTALYWIVAIVFFDWAVQKSGQAMHTAWVIGLSMILLVDVNYVMVGRRELTPALISVVTILVIWSGVAFVYDKLSDAA